MSGLLVGNDCQPCRGIGRAMDEDEFIPMMAEVPDWKLTIKRHKGQDCRTIKRSFEFGDFAQTQTFVSAVGAMAEEQGHHPDIEHGWGYAHITFFTHELGGLTKNDFICAAKVDEILARGQRTDNATSQR